MGEANGTCPGLGATATVLSNAAWLNFMCTCLVFTIDGTGCKVTKSWSNVDPSDGMDVWPC